jgi:hypothetical protein
MYEVYEYIATRGCSTVASLAKTLGVKWDQAMYVAELLEMEGKVIEVMYGGNYLWCVDEKVAEEEVNRLRMEVWRLICNAKLKHVYPVRLTKLVAKDAQALEAFTKFIPAQDMKKASWLKFIDAALSDLLGEIHEKRSHHKVYAVPPNFCTQPPRHVKLQYPSQRHSMMPPNTPETSNKQQHSTVTFNVPEAMARDLELAVKTLGIAKTQLVRVAIKRLLEQYQHLLKT